MDEIIRLIGPEHAVEFLGVRLVGINAVNGTKLLLSFGFIILVLLLKRVLGFLARVVLKARGRQAGVFRAFYLLSFRPASFCMRSGSIFFASAKRL